MSATNDTPLKRFTAFWVVLGAFLLFGILALLLAPLANTSEVTAADAAGAERRLAVRALVEEEQAKNLARTESGGQLQVPPAEVFSFVGAKLASAKPAAVKDEKFRDPAAVAAEAAAEAPAEEATPAETAPAEAVVPEESDPAPEPVTTPAPAEATEANPALTPQAPSAETETEPADPSSL